MYYNALVEMIQNFVVNCFYDWFTDIVKRKSIEYIKLEIIWTIYSSARECPSITNFMYLDPSARDNFTYSRAIKVSLMTEQNCDIVFWILNVFILKLQSPSNNFTVKMCLKFSIWVFLMSIATSNMALKKCYKGVTTHDDSKKRI